MRGCEKKSEISEKRDKERIMREKARRRVRDT
jgi:hypothetical protein